MPKYRQLHTKIIDSFDFNEMPNDFTRVVWLMLPLILDCEGRGIGSMAWVKSKLFPLREDVTNAQLQAAFDCFSNKGMIIFYQVEGHSYFYIPTFKTYQSGTQKESKSVLPDPPELLQSNSGVSKEQVSAAESAYESESESVIESESLLKDLNAQKHKKTLPSEMDVGRIFTEVTGMVFIPSGDHRGEYIESVLQMLQTYGHDETLERMKAAYNAWKGQHTKDGRQYSKTNLAWINYAVAGEVPGGNGSSSKVKSVAEEIAEELAHDRQQIRH